MNNSTVPILPQFHYSESEHVEPGLLPVFRLFVALQIVLLLSGKVASLLTPVNHASVAPLSMWYLLWLVLLFVYLSWPRMMRILGAWFLPIALLGSSVLPIVDQNLRLAMRVNQLEPPLLDAYVIASGWRVLIFLLVPLVLIAWQYDFRHVLIFSLGSTLLDLAVIYLVFEVLNISSLLLWIGMPIARLLMFTLLGFIIVRMMSVQREQRAFLTKANTQLARYASTLEQLTVSRERNRLARELHDTMAHSLSAVSVQLEAVDSAWDVAPEKARMLLHKAQAQTRSGLTETRRALQALRASPLEDLGLSLALRNLAETTAQRAGLKLQLSVQPELKQLTPDVEQGIYRVAQEALENVVKHAGATQVEVSLRQDAEHTTLLVRDDGCGFHLENIHENGHYGLQGMQERAQMMGAALDVITAPAQGTTVRLLWESP